MKAVVLVGGEGTRLRPITETLPKPLVPFMNRPFLDRVLDHLAAHGVEEAILSSPHLEDRFRAFLRERTEGPAVAWITEPEPLGTCGAVAGARDLLDGTFLVLNGDVLTDLDLTGLVGSHRDRGAVATIALTRVEDARPYGLVETKLDGRVLAFREKPSEPVPGEVNAGTYVLEPEALDDVPAEVPVSIERETFPALIEAGAPVYAVVSEAYWRDLGTPEAYLAAHADALEGRVGGYDTGGPLVDPTADVDPDASVSSAVVVGPGARVGGGAVVDRSVLHRAAVVGGYAKVEGTILGPRSEIGDGALVRDAILGEEARVASGARLENERVSGSSGSASSG